MQTRKNLEEFHPMLTLRYSANDYLAEHNFSLKALVKATDFKKLALLQDAANVMCETLEIKRHSRPVRLS